MDGAAQPCARYGVWGEDEAHDWIDRCTKKCAEILHRGQPAAVTSLRLIIAAYCISVSKVAMLINWQRLVKAQILSVREIVAIPFRPIIIIIVAQS